MKIALYNVTTTTKTGGVESFVWELARHLTELYPDCHVDIVGGKAPADFRLPDAGFGGRIVIRPFVPREKMRRLPILSRQYWLTKLLERLTFGAMTLKLLARERYDILHIQKPYDLPVAKLARWLWKTRVLFGCHGKDYFPTDRFWAKNVTDAVSCSRYNAQTVQERYGISPVVVYNGIDTELFKPRPLNAELRAKYAAPEEFLVMHVGRQVRWKGAQYLIEAIALLTERGVPVRAIFAGDGSYQPDLKRIATEKGVADRVIFLGNVPNRELPEYYACVDAVIGTSFANETFGISLCEAAACERAIVASDFGGFREVVVNGETGFLYPPQNSVELADRLEKLLQDPELRRRMGQTGRRFVVENFTWQQVAARVYAEYVKLMHIP
jgi:D-inositol-3-phosphate glycosyltransferase